MTTYIAVCVLLAVIFFTAFLTPDVVPRHAALKYKREHRLKMHINRAILVSCATALAAIAVF